MSLIKYVPNTLTISRICASPMIIHWVATEQTQLAVPGLIVAGLTDALDGHIARKYDASSALGSILDPVADKVLIGGVISAMAYSGIAPLWVVGPVLARDVALLGAGAFMLSKGKSFEVKASNASKINTAVQLTWMASVLSTHAFGMPDPMFNDILAPMVVLSTAWSAGGYVMNHGFVSK